MIRKSILTLILPAAALLGLSLMPRLAIADPTADPTADAKSAIQSALNFADDSLVHKNLDGAVAILTDDYIDIDGAKTHNLHDVRAAFAGLFVVAKSLSSTTTITDFVLHGKEAEVTTHDLESVVIVNTATLQDIKHSFDDTERMLWVQQGGVWKEKHSRNLSHQENENIVASIDGQNGSGSIVGKWFATVPGPGGKPVQWTIAYLPNGSEYQQLLYGTGKTVNIEATYTAQNNILTETLSKGNLNGEATGTPGRATSINYKVDADTLTLSLPTSRVPFIFSRVKP